MGKRLGRFSRLMARRVTHDDDDGTKSSTLVIGKRLGRLSHMLAMGKDEPMARFDDTGTYEQTGQCKLTEAEVCGHRPAYEANGFHICWPQE